MKIIIKFLKQDLYLEINKEKTKLIYVLQEKAHFLGMTIKMIPVQNIASRRSKYIKKLWDMLLKKVFWL
jgi:hypothetical protein